MKKELDKCGYYVNKNSPISTHHFLLHIKGDLMKKITILGSINMDMVIEVDNIPKKGETIFGNSLAYFPGGKGANQGVAARRLGNHVTILGAIGNDEIGEQLYTALGKEGIVIDRIKRVEDNSGLAIIKVEKTGENNIVVLKGANDYIDIQYIKDNKDIIVDSDIIISQFEIPIEVIEEGFKIAKENDTVTILNPAPGRIIEDSLLSKTDIIIPNETEAEIITGISPDKEENMIEIGKYFLNKGVKAVILTLGEKGSFLMTYEKYIHIDAEKVEAIDTTAAGDSFVGAFSTMINSLDFRDLLYAVKIGTKAAALTVQKKGAQESLPYLREIKFKRQ